MVAGIDPIVTPMFSSLTSSLKASETHEAPYRHWILENVFPAEAAKQMETLPFVAAELAGVSGRRELHNAQRNYFAGDVLDTYPVTRQVAELFQDPATVAMLEDTLGADIEGTYVRLEYAQDTDGFWLEPHTDLGVKKFTMLVYLSSDPSHAELGTDIYAAKDQHIGRSPFVHNGALIFLPADNTWHGFEPRPIQGVRTSLIVNYVTNDWRAREQLAYGDRPVTRG